MTDINRTRPNGSIMILSSPLFGILLISFLLLAGCCASSAPQEQSQTPQTTSGNTPAKTNYCPNIKVPAHGLEVCTYCSAGGYEVTSDVLAKVDWDGWEWEKDSFSKKEYQSLVCEKGKSKGENVNYQYCQYILGTITKSFADSQGNVVKSVDYYMKWVYVPSGDNYQLKEIQYYTSWINDKPTCTTQYN